MTQPASRRALPFLLLAVTLAAPAWAAWRWSGARALALDLGPGDGPYVHGFAPEWEVDDKVGTHWTTYEAGMALPLEVRGALRVTLRYARVLPQTAVVDVRLNDRAIGRFECRGGVWEERGFDVVVPSAVPARVSLHVDSHDRRNLGLKLDWLRLDARAARLSGWTRVRPVVTVAVLFLLGLALGWRAAAAACGTVPASAALTVLLLRDAWLTHRLLTLVPECLAAGALLVLVARGLEPLRAGFPSALKVAGAVAAYAFVLRAGAVNHPAFYYPDLLVHARLVEVLRTAGLDFLRAPSHHIWGEPGDVSAEGRSPSGLWLKDVGGRAYGLPYSLAFHAPLAPFEATLDRRIAWLKVWGAALSVVPIVVAGALARRWGLSLLVVGAMLLVPTYLSRLTLALMPALFGHAAEMLFIAWLARQDLGALSPRAVAAGALLLSACQLAYVSPSASLLVALLAAGTALGHEPVLRAGAKGLAVMLLAASALSVALYYRDFIAPWLSAGGGGAGVRGAGAGAGFENPLRRILAVFGAAFVLAAAGGAAWVWRTAPARLLVGAWALVGALLLAARSLVPLMRFAHEELWLAPLVCLASGQVVAGLWWRGGWRRAVAVAIGAALVVEGTLLQWRALAAQLHAP